MDISLEKIDLIRQRTGLSYVEARELLEDANGEVLEALVLLEEEQDMTEKTQGLTAGDFFSPVKRVIRQSNRTKIRVKNEDGTLLEIPATIGLVGAFLAPKITALGAAALLAAHYSLEVQPPEQAKDNWEN